MKTCPPIWLLWATAVGFLLSLASPVEAHSNVQSSCPTTSTNTYSSGPMYQFDNDNPVRPAYNHADKNLALRGYSAVNAAKALVSYGSDDPVQPPQLATLFNPSRLATFSNVYNTNNWNWQPSPNPGTRGGPVTAAWPVTVLGLQTTPGEALRSPTHGRNIGNDFGAGGAMVIFADADSITLKFTREDTAATGYTVHIDNICTDPNLLALYNSLDNNARNTYSAARPYSYNLPGLTAGKVFGTARDTEIRVAIVDTGSFMDPRSQNEWWQIRPTPSPTTTFSDVPATHWAYGYVEALYKAGYTSGCSTNPMNYCPELTMNRAESAVFVVRGIHGASYLPAEPATKRFDDVALGQWYTKWATQLASDNYTAGCGSNPPLFCPTTGHTRAEGSVFYLRMLNGSAYVPPEPASQLFADVPLNQWYAKWAQAAYNADLIEPCETSPQLKFCPDGPLTRALAAYMMVKAKQLPVP